VTLLSDRLDDSTRVRGAVQRSLMLRIKDYIGQRFRDPALGPAEIAAAVSISARYLHKLFEADRQTVSLYIKGLRLDRARQDLLDPRQAGRSISRSPTAAGSARSPRTGVSTGRRCCSGRPGGSKRSTRS